MTARRAPAAFASIALVVAALAAAGCVRDVQADAWRQQPLAFSHAKHLRYFVDGRHRDEAFKRHSMTAADAPPELAQGRCPECHSTFDEVGACAGCHRTFQDVKTRAATVERPCLGCHRTAWSGYQAGIPTIATCQACHGGAPRTSSDMEGRLRATIARREDIRWVQVKPLGDNVFFSHVAHVRFGELRCTACHPLTPGERALPQMPVLAMADCIGCHQRRGAATDCLTCHK